MRQEAQDPIEYNSTSTVSPRLSNVSHSETDKNQVHRRVARIPDVV